MPAIVVTDLTKCFRRDRRALDAVNLTIEPGEMVALIGASGSGKSTLLRHIAGLVTGDRDSGPCCIDVLGHRVQQNGRLAPSARRVRGDIGSIFQQFNLVGRLSVLTNVLTGCLGRIPAWQGTLGLFGSVEKRAAMVALARVGMAEFARQRASTLSGGQQQRAAIARTLLQRARVLLADEPIASLDPASSVRVMEILSRINREDGITIVVSLHQVEYARTYCPRTLAMRDGRIVYDGPSSALSVDFLRELYGADSEELVMAPAESPPRGAPEPLIPAVARA